MDIVLLYNLNCTSTTFTVAIGEQLATSIPSIRCNSKQTNHNQCQPLFSHYETSLHSVEVVQDYVTWIYGTERC